MSGIRLSELSVSGIHTRGLIVHDEAGFTGKNTFETETFVNQSYGTQKGKGWKSGVVVVGSAAENGVNFFIVKNDGSYHKKAVSNILTFGNDWKAFETDDGCRYVLGEGFVREDGQRVSISNETKEKWVSREELNQYEKTFGKPIKQLENNIEKK